jgi:pimeloyl-ACP methyl ester carboxylesterase
MRALAGGSMRGSLPLRSRSESPTVERRRVELPGRGVEIGLLEWGGDSVPEDAPLVLMHHANGFCAGTLGLVAEALTPAFRVVGMDARGHGGSSRPEGPAAYRWEEFALDVLAVAEALAPPHGGRVAVGLGHSFGGTAMLGAAARRPELFERLVLVDPVLPAPPGWTAVDPERGERVARLVDGARRRRSVWESRAEARAHFARRSLFRRWLPAALDAYVECGLHERADGRVELACPGAVEAAIFAAAHGFDVADLARRAAAVPTTVLWARHGDFPRALFERVFGALPHARLVDVEAGHLVAMERPELVVREVVAAVPARADRSTPCAP